MHRKLQRWMMATLGLSGLVPLALASALSDPTRPANRDTAGSVRKVMPDNRAWVLSSTLVAPQRRVAVINGRLVSEGELVDGAKVIEIRKLKVLIQVPGRRITLQLLPDTLKQHEKQRR